MARLTGRNVVTIPAPAAARDASPTLTRREHTALPGFSFRDVILGGQDGLVNVLGLVLGMATATGDARVVVTAALAAMLAESIAMAGVAYTSSRAESGLAARQREDGFAALAADHRDRAAARQASLVAEGLSAEQVDRIMAEIGAEGDTWQARLRQVEGELAPVRHTRPLRGAVVVGISTLVGSSVPLVPFLVAPMAIAPWMALAAGATVLFVAGVQRARLAGGSIVREGLEILAIGLLSALAGYLIGLLLRSPV